MRLQTGVVLLLAFSLFACKEKQNSTAVKKEPQAAVPDKAQPANGDTYFSITDFFKDQWKSRKGMPYTLLRIVTLNGKTDSAFVELDSALWAGMTAPFEAADISDKKFAGQYDFNIFDDEGTLTSNLNFEAKKPELFMQKMFVGADINSHLVQSVYIETKTSRDGYIHTQKLNYAPDRIFQIQEFEKSTATPAKNLKIEYRYKY